MKNINLNDFIGRYITRRSSSLFLQDLETNHEKLKSLIEKKSVLVIGGAGTIGSNFIKQIINFSPFSLTIVDNNENGLTELTRDLRSLPNVVIPENYLSYPMDFGSEVFERMFKENNGFQVVANFAAHKHVRSEKDEFAIEAMITNNVFKAEKLLDLLREFPPEHFFCVSTDKAANPVNVMGASKKLMENLIMSYSEFFPVTTARFANVAFSNGSLLDGYFYRLKKEQPLSCPSDVKRYFVSPEESGQICLLACFLANNREIFFPKLKSQDLVLLKNITTDFIHALGFKPDVCESEEEAKSKKIDYSNKKYPVYFFSSNTSGEKLYEEFYSSSDVVNFSKFHSLGIIEESEIFSVNEMKATLEKLKELFKNENLDKSEIVNFLMSILPDFEHKETGRSLDQQM